MKGEIKDRESAIATLQNELELVRSEILDKDMAIATFQTELDKESAKLEVKDVAIAKNRLIHSHIGSESNSKLGINSDSNLGGTNLNTAPNSLHKVLIGVAAKICLNCLSPNALAVFTTSTTTSAGVI